MDFIHIAEKEYPNPNPNDSQKIPRKIFIVPYRDRVQHKFFFSKYMSFILEDEEPGNYEIYFSHQTDNRPFNRGAAKNIGFLAMKQKYPKHYQDMTFIFNDVDTVPFNKIYDYDTQPGFVQHLYGFNFALGGIVIFKGRDFEMINGYPNYWGWGQEDNVLQHRCMKRGLTIDRRQFVSIGDQDILQLFDGIKRIVVNNALTDAKFDNGFDGLRTIHNLTYSIDEKSAVEEDTANSVMNPYIFYINIFTFEALYAAEEKQLSTIDLRDKPRKIKDYNVPRLSMNFGKEVLNNNTEQTTQHVQNNTFGVQSAANIYSPEYAKKMGIKPRATTSVKMTMGGIR
jgi:hypothetical protein